MKQLTVQLGVMNTTDSELLCSGLRGQGLCRSYLRTPLPAAGPAGLAGCHFSTQGKQCSPQPPHRYWTPQKTQGPLNGSLRTLTWLGSQGHLVALGILMPWVSVQFSLAGLFVSWLVVQFGSLWSLLAVYWAVWWW